MPARQGAGLRPLPGRGQAPGRFDQLKSLSAAVDPSKTETTLINTVVVG